MGCAEREADRFEEEEEYLASLETRWENDQLKIKYLTQKNK
jgi:hypothetical protein